MAAWNKNHEVVRILVKNDITVAIFVVMAIALCIMQQISFQSISSTLFYGGANKELTTHKSASEYGADAVVKREIPLSAAIERGHVEVVKLLLKTRADPREIFFHSALIPLILGASGG
ncbi:hypothetical protein LI328DRAFT_149659 [Trichoderma asperelloides]|nr:hypothetical protein LI328DRAFT_149659 [Trichoderma asperelloides]